MLAFIEVLRYVGLYRSFVLCWPVEKFCVMLSFVTLYM